MPTPPLNPSHRDWPEVEKAWKVYHDEWGEKLERIAFNRFHSLRP